MEIKIIEIDYDINLNFATNKINCGFPLGNKTSIIQTNKDLKKLLKNLINYLIIKNNSVEIVGKYLN